MSLTEEQINNAGLDIAVIGKFTNDAADAANPGHAAGTVTNRTGSTFKNLKAIIADIYSQVDSEAIFQAVAEIESDLQAANDALADAQVVAALIGAGAVKGPFDTTADALSNGVVGYTITAPGSGGTAGSYALTLTGGSGTEAAAKVVVAGGALVGPVVIQSPGKNYATAPAVSFTVPGITGSPAITAVIGINAPVGSYFAVIDTANGGYLVYKNVAGVATYQFSTAAPGLNLKLPTNVEAFYPCDEGSGTTLRDIVRGRTCTLAATSGVGTIGWTKDGFLETVGAAFLLPAMTHRAIAIIYQMPEADNTNAPLFCSSASERFSRNSFTVGETSAVRLMSGWGITTPRASSTGIMVAMEGPGWHMVKAAFAATRTGTPSIGSNFVAPTVRAAYMKIAGIVVFNADPSDADLRRVLNFARPQAAARGAWLSAEDCPEEAFLLVNDGESLDDGRFSGLFTGSTTGGDTVTVGAVLRGVIAEGAEVVLNGVGYGALILPFGTGGSTGTGGTGSYKVDRTIPNSGSWTITTAGLSKSQQDAVADCLYVNSFNAAGQFPVHRKFERYSTKPPYSNGSAAAGTPVINSGWEVGIRDALMQRPHDGRKKFILKLGMGSTYLTRSGDGVTTITSVVTKGSFVNATIAGNVLTVPAQTVAGHIAPGDTLSGSGVTAGTTIAAFGTGGTTGTGGAGTYQLNQSMTVASGTAMTTGYQLYQSTSRNPGVLLPNGLTSTVHERFLLRQESAARAQGIGFTTVVFATSEGLNDAYLGDLNTPNAATYQALLQAKYDYYSQVTGIFKPTWILMKPHLPVGGLGGSDVDYPNNQAGQSRLNALNFIRTACDSVSTANIGGIFTFDWNGYDMNNGTDFVHPSAVGNVNAGKDFDGKLRDRVGATASSAGTVLTVTNVSYGAFKVGMELAEALTGTYIPRGIFISSFGTGTGGTGTYNLSASLTYASGPIATVELYRKRIQPVA